MKKINSQSKKRMLIVAVVALLALNAKLAFSHQWNRWHWNKSTIKYYNFASFNAEAQRAINDWNACNGLRLRSRNSHTDISVFDGNYGNTGWAGLAEIKETGWDWGSWSYTAIKHGHARYNSNRSRTGGTGTNSTIRGIQCQEVGHLFGLDHSNNGCMGKGYFNNSNVVDRAHSCGDVNTYTH